MTLAVSATVDQRALKYLSDNLAAYFAKSARTTTGKPSEFIPPQPRSNDHADRQ